jgi:uncharacterized LabA/DUF88 family protein
MDRLAIFVDAGYLMAQLGKIKTRGERASRAELSIAKPKDLARMLIVAAEGLLGNNRLLRLYWYDGAKNGQMTAEHRAIVSVDDVQLRLGSINNVGQQKGVDSRIVTDIIDLAQKHAISDAVVVSGDADLAVGIEIAQRSGLRVGLLGFAGKSLDGQKPVKHAQSEEIVLIADRHLVITPDMQWLSTILHTPTILPTSTTETQQTIATPLPAQLISTQANTADLTKIDAAVRGFFDQLKDKPEPDSLLPSIPGEIDKALLNAVRTALGRILTDSEKRNVRAKFRGLAGELS